MAKDTIGGRTSPNSTGAEEQWTWEERRRLLHIGIDVAEKLDELERRVDPRGPPPRHAAQVQQRLRAMMRDRDMAQG